MKREARLVTGGEGSRRKGQKWRVTGQQEEQLGEQEE